MGPVSAVVSVGVPDLVLASQHSAEGLVLVASDLDLAGDLVGAWDSDGARAGATRGPGTHSASIRLEPILPTAIRRRMATHILRALVTTPIMALATIRTILRRLILLIHTLHTRPLRPSRSTPTGTAA